MLYVTFRDVIWNRVGR